MSSISSSSSSSTQGQIKVIAGAPVTITKKRWGRPDKTVPGQMVLFEAGARVVASVAARVFEDHEVDEVLKKLAKSEGRGSNRESKYVAVHITDDEGKKKYFLMRADDVKQILGALPDKTDKANYVVPASELFNFIVQRDKEVMREAALIKEIREMKKLEPSSRRVGEPELERATTGMGHHQQVQLRAMERSMSAQGIEPAQAQQIGQYVIEKVLTGKYKDTSEYRDFQLLPAAEQSEGFRIDKETSRLNYSIIVGNDGSVELQLKTKPDNVPKEDRMSERGGDKTVKTSLDLMTGKIKVQVTIDISAPVRAEAANRPGWNRLSWMGKQGVLEKLEIERIEKIKKNDFDLPNEVCGLKASNFTIHRVHATPQGKMAQRMAKGKPIREEGDIVVSYTMVKADGDLTKVGLVENIRGQQMDGVHVSSQFKKAVMSLLQQVKTLQARNPPIVHRDIKPQNIFVLGEELHLMDLGFVKEVDAQGRAVGNIRGTLYCMAPELALLALEQGINRIKLELAELRWRHKRIGSPALQTERKRVSDREAEISKQANELDLRKSDLYSVGATIFELAIMRRNKNWDWSLTKFGDKADEIYVTLKRMDVYIGKNVNDVNTITYLEGIIPNLEKRIKEMESNLGQYRAEDRARLVQAGAPVELQDLCSDLMLPAGQRIDIDQAIKEAERLQTN